MFSVLPHSKSALQPYPPLPDSGNGQFGVAQLAPPPAEQKKIPSEKNASQGALDYLAKFGLTSLIALSTLMLFSRPIAHTARILTSEKYGLQNAWPKGYTLLSKATDSQEVIKKLKRGIHIMALIQLSSNFQVSINTEQPSKFLASLMYGLRSLLMIIQPNRWAESLNFFGSTLWLSGERNDIENSNHPEKRRGLSLQSLIERSADGKRHLNREALKHAQAFMLDDVKYALSSAPWKNLVSHLKKPSEKGASQSYLTALGAQFNFFSWIGLLTMLGINKRGSGNLKRAVPYLKHLSQISAGASILLPSIPLAHRAWQSRTEKDGIYTLLGIPLATTSRVALASPTLNALSGIGGIGQSLIQEGKRLNSKKYRALVEYLKSLCYQAQCNPDLTARDVLQALEESPKDLQKLQKSMGKVRANYLLDLLKKGPTNPEVPLWTYLYPLTLNRDNLAGA